MVTNENSPRSPKDVVLEAELLASSPERVKEWLEETSTASALPSFGRPDHIERALLERGDPLIALSLARYGSNRSVLQAILAGPARDNKPLRLAALMNEVVGRVSYGLIGAFLESQEIQQFLQTLDAEEISALFANSELDDSFLSDFLEQKEPWQALDEESRFTAIAALGSNGRMHSPYDGPYDGFAEYSHNRVFAAAWELADKVPVTVKWAAYLGSFYETVVPVAYSIKNPLELASRWVPDPSDADRLQAEQKDIERGRLGVFAGMRRSVTRLAVMKLNSAERRALATHEDPAIRAAYYAYGDLTADEIKAADERDPVLSFDELVWNDAVWQTKTKRDLLHKMAWDKKRDPDNRMDSQNTFEARLEFYRRTHPEWFKDEEDEEKREAARWEEPDATAFDGDDARSALIAANSLAKATHLTVMKVLQRLAWIGWGLAAVLALLLFRGR